ncbi:prolipoprotein diacylglyceryl transferase family protein [Polyangium sorediatum]|uniref:Prolipoprotein diacylglyceryl transferase n=1 Tax=Polyangium sorediatum TaxID=889274 RepID=A0ABT6PAD5_9BACT|nr:prolipoprotein diacylglyceryl transferase family protein [Polyangium sorediatum]MDI1437572.1 prolipoprotein diacylglyceryl transferase [Polyangium sorediatum]
MIPWFTFPALPFGLHAFGLLLTLSVIVNHLVLVRRARALALGSKGAIEALAIGTVAAAIGGAYGVGRLVGGGGTLSSAGGCLGAIVGLVGLARALRMPVLVAADATTYAFPFGWIFARAACAFAHDHPGRLSSSFLAVQYPGGARFDLGLLEGMATPLLVVLVVLVSRRASRPGVVTGALALAYGALRFGLDFLRAEDGRFSDPRWHGLTAAQGVCLGVMIPIGITLLLLHRPHRGRCTRGPGLCPGPGRGADSPSSGPG